MNNSLKGRVVFITGSSTGIGAETAYKFSEEGCKIVITYYQDKQEAEKVVEKCKQLGSEDILVLPLNVMADDSIKNTVRDVVDKFGRIDILINNAGVYMEGLLKDKGFDEIEIELRTNLEGTIKVTRESLPYIKETIINIASGLSLRGMGGAAVYSASKFGVRGFSQALAEELSDIRVYIVNPTTTATKMTGFFGQDPKEVAEVVLKTAMGEYNLPSGADINVWEVS